MNPALHDTHFSAPTAGQPTPVCPTPFLHTHVFPVHSQSIHVYMPTSTRLPAHVTSNTRTNTLCAIVTDCEPSVARRAFRGTAKRTTHASLRHAVMACAHVHCQIAMHQSACTILLTVSDCSYMQHCTHTQTHIQAHVRIHFVFS